MIQACKDRFASRTADEQALSQAAMEQLNADLHYATETSEASLSRNMADAEGAMAGANDERK
jgi:hypothetical protein